MGRSGHQLGNRIGFRVGKIQRPAHVPDGAPGRHGAEGGNLGHMVGAILAHDVLDDLRAALLTEIRVEIRHTHPFRVQKPLENQGIFHGVHFGDVHTVGRDGACAGAAPRANGNPLLLGVADEVPDDEVVVYITHAADDTDLVFQSVSIFLGFVWVTLPEAVITKLPEVALVGVPFRHRKGGQVIFVKGEFQIAAVGNFRGIFKGFLQSGEQFLQFFLAFDVEFLGLEFHAVLVIHGFAGLDAQQHILHFGVLPAQVMGIVGDHQRQARFSCQTLNALIDGPLLVNAVILQLKEEVSLTKNFRQFQGVFFCPLVVLPHEVLGHRPRQTGGQGNQPIVVLLQKCQIHSWLAVKAVDKGLRHQIAQVFVSCPVLAQQHQMVGVVVQPMHLIRHAPPGHIHLAADDRLDSGGLGRLVKVDTAVHDAVVGDGNGGLAQLLDPVHEAVNPAGPVQEAVFTM